jgi:hypothetical protein
MDIYKRPDDDEGPDDDEYDEDRYGDNHEDEE